MTCSRRVMFTLAVSGMLTSCVEVVPYRPNTHYADRLDGAEVQMKFGEVMTRTIRPRILSARMTEHFYEYEIEETSRNVHGIPIGSTSRRVQRDFTNIGRAQLHVNNVLYVFSKDGALLDHVRFASQDDAKIFIDLIMSYRDRLKSTWSGRK